VTTAAATTAVRAPGAAAALPRVGHFRVALRISSTGLAAAASSPAAAAAPPAREASPSAWLLAYPAAATTAGGATAAAAWPGRFGLSDEEVPALELGAVELLDHLIEGVPGAALHICEALRAGNEPPGSGRRQSAVRDNNIATWSRFMQTGKRAAF
jgi:hypothetical protein